MNQPDSHPEPLTTSQFLICAALVEGGLLLLAFAGGWLSGHNPTEHLNWSLTDLGIGVLATIPMLVLFGACFLLPSRGLQQIRRFLRDAVGPLLNHCHWYDLVLLSLLAGICEEALFRGFLYHWIQDWNPFLAVFLVNLLFAAAHSITPLYALMAGFLGLYLTALLSVGSAPSLLIPITAHTLYDLAGFWIVRADFRRHGEAGTAD